MEMSDISKTIGDPGYREIPMAHTKHIRRFQLIIHGMLWVVLLALYAFGVPKIEAIVNDFGVPLPELTVRVIQVSHFLIVLSVLTVLLLVTDWRVLGALSRRDDALGLRYWSVLRIVTPLLLIVLTLVALILPFQGIHRLSG